MSGGQEIPVERLLEPGGDPRGARAAIAELYMDQKVVDYIVDLVRATRDPGSVGLAELKPLIAFGGSPRASIALAQAARAHAFLRGRAYVVPGGRPRARARRAAPPHRAHLRGRGGGRRRATTW